MDGGIFDAGEEKEEGSAECLKSSSDAREGANSRPGKKKNASKKTARKGAPEQKDGGQEGFPTPDEQGPARETRAGKAAGEKAKKIAEAGEATGEKVPERRYPARNRK